LSATDSATIQDLINKYFQIARSKEIENIPDFFDDRFTKFGDSPPYDRRELERALMLEQLQFASISDYDFKIDDLKVDMMGETAVASFMLQSTGMIVDDYSFRGTTINNRSRVTIVFQKDKKYTWKMLHHHFSKMPG
jgi:ketosteroid isomerase-like protein